MIDPMTVKLLNFCDYLVSVLTNDPTNKGLNTACATAEGRVKLMESFGIPASVETDPGYIIAHYDKSAIGTQVVVDQLVSLVGQDLVGFGMLPPSSPVPTQDWTYTNIYSFLAWVLQSPALQEELRKNPSGVCNEYLTNDYGERAAVADLFKQSNEPTLYKQVDAREKNLQTSMNTIVNSFWKKFSFS